MGLLLGALAGAGEAFTDIADNHIKQWDTKSLMALQEQVEIAKEQRIEEMNKREGIRKEEFDIRAEGRAYEGKKRDREETFSFNTDPANAERAAQAKLTEQAALDDYRYKRGSEEANYQGMLARAKDIDHTDYEGRRLAHEAARRALASGVSDKISEVDKLQIQLLGKEAEGLQKAIGEGMLQDEDMLSAKMRLREVRSTIQDTLAKYQGGSQSASTLDDPLGLRTPPAGNDDDREQLLRAIEATGATIDTLDNTRTEDLRAVLADAQQEKISRKLGGDSRESLVKQIKALVGDNLEIPDSYSKKDLQKILRDELANRKEQQARNERRKKEAEQQAKSKAEKDAEFEKRATGLLNRGRTGSPYFSSREGGM